MYINPTTLRMAKLNRVLAILSALRLQQTLKLQKLFPFENNRKLTNCIPQSSPQPNVLSYWQSI